METMSIKSENNWNGSIKGETPLQGYGLVDNHSWYFRARGESWSMQIAKDKQIDRQFLPLVGLRCSGWLIKELWGTWPDSGYMKEDEAWNLIENTIKKFRENDLEYIHIEK